MKKKLFKYIKFLVSLVLILSLVAPSYASLSASDGSAFVTKAEFDSALADFNARLTTFEAGINSKIDSQVTSYLDRNGIWSGQVQETTCHGLYPVINVTSNKWTKITSIGGWNGALAILVKNVSKSGLLFYRLYQVMQVFSVDESEAMNNKEIPGTTFGVDNYFTAYDKCLNDLMPTLHPYFYNNYWGTEPITPSAKYLGNTLGIMQADLNAYDGKTNVAPLGTGVIWNNRGVFDEKRTPSATVGFGFVSGNLFVKKGYPLIAMGSFSTGQPGLVYCDTLEELKNFWTATGLNYSYFYGNSNETNILATLSGFTVY